MKTPAKKRAQNRAYYARNREKVLAQKKAYAATPAGAAKKRASSAEWSKRNRSNIRNKRKRKNISESH